jgi:hypothetical protein
MCDLLAPGFEDAQIPVPTLAAIDRADTVAVFRECSSVPSTGPKAVATRDSGNPEDTPERVRRPAIPSRPLPQSQCRQRAVWTCPHEHALFTICHTLLSHRSMLPLNSFI